MRISKTCGLCVVMLLCVFAVSCAMNQDGRKVRIPAGESVEDLFVNGDFEGKPWGPPAGGMGSYPEGWGVHLTFNGTLEVIDDPQHVHSGKQSAHLYQAMNVPRPEKHAGYRARVLNRTQLAVNPLHTYVFTFWAKGKGDVTIFAYETTASGKFVGSDAWGYRTQDRKPLTDEWRQYVFEYRSSHDMVGRISAGIELLGEGAEIYVDDAAFLLDCKRFPKPKSTLAAKAKLEGGGDVTLFLNGEEVKAGGFVLKSGENVFGIKATKPVAGTITTADGRSVAIDESWKGSTAVPEGWFKRGFDDRKWQPLSAKDDGYWGDNNAAVVHLRRSVFLEIDASQNWLAGNPRVFYVPRDSVEYMAAILRAPTDSPVDEFDIVVEAPEVLRLLDPAKVPDRAYLSAKAVAEEQIKVGGAPYRRYTITYDWSVPASTEIIKGWTIKGKNDKVRLGLLAFKMEGEPKDETFPIYLRRHANNNASDLTRTVTVKAERPFKDTKLPKRIILWQTSPPYRWGGKSELMDGERKKYPESGVNWVHSGPPELLKKGIQIGAWWNHGMNYQVTTETRKEGLSGSQKALLDHPELWGKWYDGPKEAMPASWQRAVAHKWFQQRILWEEEYREKHKPVIWCQEYLAQGGKVYLDAWRKQLLPVKKNKPYVKYLFWDWEYSQIGFSTFSEMDLDAFRKRVKLGDEVKLTAEIIARKHPKEWEDFRFDQTGRHCKTFKKMLNEIGLELWVYSGGTNYPGPGTHLYWKYVVGGADAIFLGQPGAGYPHIWPQGSIESGEKLREWFGKDIPIFGQLVRSPEVSTADATVLPSQRKNDILRVCVSLRGGVNVWSNIRILNNYNGADHFQRAAAEVLAKYESHIMDGPRCTDEFIATNMLQRDLMAFKLEGQPVALFVFNDHGSAQEVKIEWQKATGKTVYVDGETGKRLGKGKKVSLSMAPSSVIVVECR